MTDAAHAAAELLKDETHLTKLTFALLAERGSATARQVEDTLGASRSAATRTLKRLYDLECVTRERRDVGARGRDPMLYTARVPDRFQEVPGDLKLAVIESMADRHYRRRLSIVTVTQLADDLGVTPQRVAAVIRDLRDEPDPPIETVHDGERKHYRLVGAGEYQTYRVGGTSEGASAEP